MLWAFEPVKYCSAAPRLSRGTSRRSAWKPPQQQHARLGLAVREDPLDQFVAGEGVHQRRRARRRRGCRGRRRSRSRGGGCRPSRCPPRARARAARRPAPRPCRTPPPSAAVRRTARCSSSALRMSASFFAPMPFMRADPPVARRRFELVERARRRARGRAAPRSSARHPAGAAGRASSAETPAAAPGGSAIAPVSTSSPILAARSLPMPGSASRSAGVSVATGSRRRGRSCRRRCGTRGS